MKPDLIIRWASDAATRGMEPKTIDSYCYRIGVFERFCNGQKSEQAEKMLIRAYVDEMRKKGAVARTIQNHLIALSNFYEFLVFEGIRQDNPVGEVRKRYLSSYKADSEIHTHKLISVEEAARLVSCCMDIRDKAIVLVLLKTGVRRGESLSMEVKDINFSKQSIVLKPKKKRSNRMVFFDSETEYVLRQWLEVRKNRHPRTDALWITSWGKPYAATSLFCMMQRASIMAGLHDSASNQMEDHFSPHACRHFFTTHLLRAGMPRDYVKWLRGDAMKEAIDIYYHIDAADVRKSYLAHVPQLGV